MARIGWVAAGEVGTDGWYRLTVFDDGWVDLPGFGRSLSDTRTNLRRSLRTLAVVIAGGLALWGLSLLADTVHGATATVVRIAAVVVLLGTLGYVYVQAIRMTTRDRRQGRADYAQARLSRDAGQRVRLAPGAPRWRRADSAEQLAGSLTGVRLSRALEVATVVTTVDAPDLLVRIEFHDGTIRQYRTPDRKIRQLLGRFGSTVTR